MLRRVLVLALLTGFANTAGAHPHVFVEHRVTLQFDEAGLQALRVEWTFDELYSASLIADFLDRKRTAPTAAQVTAIEQQAFANAEQVNYFLVLKLDDLPAKVAHHKEFAVELEGPKVRYRFVVPVAAAKAKRLVVNALDDQWFIDFFPAKAEPIRFEGADRYKVDCDMATEPQKTVLGTVDTQVAACRWSPKP
jgi:nickel/cobalt transporter (NicO) family protein